MTKNKDENSQIKFRPALAMGRFPPDNCHKWLHEKFKAKDALTALGITWDSLKNVQNDPPDLELKFGTVTAGIEITELVNERMLALRIQKETKGIDRLSEF